MKDNFVSTIPKDLIPYQLPKNWKWFYWSDLMTNFQQGMIRSNSQLGNGNSEYLKMGDLNSNGLANFSSLAQTEASQKEINEFLLKEGDFLINVRNSKELVGKTCIIEDIENRIVLFNHMLVRIEHGSIDMNYFINAFLNIPSTKKLLDRIKQGTTTVIALYQRDLNKLPIALPDNSTFSHIAKLYKNINSKIELNNKINAELEAMAKMLYDYWFVQFDFPDANGKPYKTSGGKMVWNDELKREIPEGWKIGTLDLIGDITGGSTPSKAIDENFCSGEGTPWITPKDLSNNKGKKYITRGEYDVTERGLKEASLKIMPKGTVLLSSRAPIGYLAISRTEVTTNQGFKSFVPRDAFSTEYIYYTIQNLIPEIEANSSGSTFKEVSASTLKTIKTILPSDVVLSQFDNLIKSIFNKQDCLELENQELASLCDWLLPMLMNGQVTFGEAEEKLRMVVEEKESNKR